MSFSPGFSFSSPVSPALATSAGGEGPVPHRSPASGKRARLPPQEDPPDDNCIICCFEMPEDGKGRPADCKHVYCVACLLEWAKISNTCPMCKRSFLKICHLQKELSPAPAAGEAASAGQFTPRHDPLTGLFIVDETEIEEAKQPDDEPLYMEMTDVVTDLHGNHIPALNGYTLADLESFCYKCKNGEHEDSLLLCDGRCGRAAHTFCVGLPTIPEGDWFCSSCDRRRRSMAEAGRRARKAEAERRARLQLPLLSQLSGGHRARPPPTLRRVYNSSSGVITIPDSSPGSPPSGRATGAAARARRKERRREEKRRRKAEKENKAQEKKKKKKRKEGKELTRRGKAHKARRRSYDEDEDFVVSDDDEPVYRNPRVVVDVSSSDDDVDGAVVLSDSDVASAEGSSSDEDYVAGYVSSPPAGSRSGHRVRRKLAPSSPVAAARKPPVTKARAVSSILLDSDDDDDAWGSRKVRRANPVVLDSDDDFVGSDAPSAAVSVGSEADAVWVSPPPAPLPPPPPQRLFTHSWPARALVSSLPPVVPPSMTKPPRAPIVPPRPPLPPSLAQLPTANRARPVPPSSLLPPAPTEEPLVIPRKERKLGVGNQTASAK